MIRTGIISCLLICFVFVLQGQERVTIAIEKRPIRDLFYAIERQTDFKVYCNPAQVDTLVVSVNVHNETPVNAIKEALQGTVFSVSQYQRALFIAPEIELVTELSFASADEETSDEYTVASAIRKRDTKATSEHQIYEIGNVTEAPPGRVTINGYVTDFKTGEPIIGATLYTNDRAVSATTDGFGYYTLRMPSGRQELNVMGVDIKDTKRQLLLYADGRLDIELEEKVHMLNELVVSSERLANVRSVSIGMEKLRVREIKNIPMAFGEVDILKVVMALPGVKSVGEASSGFNVRGGATDQNLILFNDGTIYNPTHLFGVFSAFNPDVVREMELYKSSIPAKYGGRISSVLDIKSKDGNKKEFIGSASIGLLTSRLTLEGPIIKDKTSFIVAGRTTYSDWLLRQLPEDSGYNDGSAGFYDLNAMISHKFNDHNNLYVNGYYSHDRFEFSEHDKYSYQNANASVKWRSIFSPTLTGVFTTGYDHYSYDTWNTENPVEAYKLLFNINQGYLKGDFTQTIIDHTLSYGFSGLYYSLLPGEVKPVGDESMWRPDRLQTEAALEMALYVGDQWEINQQLSVDAGIRYSLFSAMGERKFNKYDPAFLPSLTTIVEEVDNKSGIYKTYHGPEFRVSARYAINNELSVKAGANSMRQYIHKISNTTIMSPTDTWKLSDYNIKPQTGIQYAAGIYKNFLNGAIETSLEGYYKSMDDYLDYRNAAELVMNHHLETDLVNTEGRAYGVELMVKKPSGRLNGWVSYTYSRTELRQSDPRILDPVNYANWYPSDFDKPHDIKLVGNYKFTHRYSASLNCDYSTGRPITLPVSKYSYAGGEYVQYSDRNQYRIPDYFRVDLSFNIEPSHHLTNLTHSMFSIGVYNLTGRKNAYSVYYVLEEGVLRGKQLSIFGAPIPFVSYNIKF